MQPFPGGLGIARREARFITGTTVAMRSLTRTHRDRELSVPVSAESLVVVEQKIHKTRATQHERN